jgi:hypothetical protein
MKNLVAKLAEIQKALNAPKGQTNAFGGYKYRSCEDILMAVKPLLGGLIITVNDDMVPVGDRIYVKATASITDGVDAISTSAFAREAVSKKGMDDAQVTGSTSSYARKYALNGLLLIDDNKDADHGDNREVQRDFAKEMKHAKSEETLKKIFAVAWKSTSDEDVKGGYKDLYEARKIEFSTEMTSQA